MRKRIEHPLEGRQLIVEADLFSSFSGKLKESSRGSKLLVALSNCSIMTVSVSPKVEAIYFDGKTNKNILGPGIIFARDFYENLLGDIRFVDICVLIGNPGIGKSQLQYYYLAKIMNPGLLGELPPDINGCTEPPKIVIRQVGKKMIVYDIKERIAYKTNADADLLGCFDPKVALYLYEPGESKDEPFFMDLDLPILATVSPDSRRYKEFQKNNGVPKYMPTYTCDELLAVGNYLAQQTSFPRDMLVEYSRERILDRFVEFGGIFRHVLPSKLSLLKKIRAQSAKAMANCDARKLMSSGDDIEDEHVSSFLMQMNVTRDGPERFEEFTTEFVSLEVKIKLDRIISKVDLKYRIETLVKNDETGFKDILCRQVYESVVATLLTSPTGVQWKARKTRYDGIISTAEWNDFNLKLDGPVMGLPLSFIDMVPNTLYFPTNEKFPAVEFFYKSNDNKLIGFQVTRQLKTWKVIKISAFQKFLNTVGLTDSSKVILYLVPTPSRADESAIEFKNAKVEFVMPTEVFVLKLPLKYVPDSTSGS